MECECWMYNIRIFKCSVFSGSVYGSECVANETANQWNPLNVFANNKQEKQNNEMYSKFESSQLCIVQMEYRIRIRYGKWQ